MTTETLVVGGYRQSDTLKQVLGFSHRSSRARRRLARLGARSWRQPLLMLAVLIAGCSVLYDLDTVQCQRDSDCQELGDAFGDSVCRSGVCTLPQSSSGGGGTATGAQGGAPAEECSSNGECIDDNFGSPFVCRDGKCIPLTIPEECPLVLGAGLDNENLRKPDPIIFGAYSFVDPLAPRRSVPTLNYELAITELNDATRGGLVGGSNGTLRPFIAIVCSGTDNPDWEASMDHLINTVGVPAIISSLFTTDLAQSFQAKGEANDVFFLSPLEADSVLTQISDDGLLWHMLAPGRDLAQAYVPLMAKTEQHLRTTKALPAEEPIKVALLESKTPFLTDMANWFFDNVEFNGLSASDNEKNGNFLRVKVDSSLEVPNPDVAAATATLTSFGADVIVAASSDESVAMFSSIEASTPPESRPFYLASPYLFGRADLAMLTLKDRVLGINWAAAEDTTLYDSYLSRLKAEYDVSFSLEGAENFYDAAYYLMYAIAAAGQPPKLSGREVAVGMTRLVAGKTRFDVGPTDANDVISFLKSNAQSQISLHGTMGPPDFNTTTGVRNGLPSIYCISSGGTYVQNAMTYEPETGSLNGTPSCIPGFP